LIQLFLCCRQVSVKIAAALNKALTSHIEAGFQRKLKKGVVFIDLTAAYNTVWRDGLTLKFMRVVSCAKLLFLPSLSW
jgi:hypothetical protein